jgi:cysteine-rich repeat protein
MHDKPLRKSTTGWRRVRQVSLAGVTLAFAVAACTDDSIVYPNRNFGAGSGGVAGGDGGPLAAAGEAGSESGGASSIGGSGATGGGAVLGDDDAGAEAGTVGAAGTMSGGAVCGNKIVEPPEECDDGNTISGDGCSAQCKSHCETCEDKVCSLGDYDYNAASGSAYDDCYNAKGNITAGPASGAPRADVCRALVDCVRQQKCGQQLEVGENIQFLRCWCDVDFSRSAKVPPIPLCQNSATFVAGKCASQFQDASEGDGPSAILNQLTRRTAALGAAVALLETCDQRVCVEECLPEYFGDTIVATITQDLTAIPNPAGESQLGDLIADAQRTAAGADAAIVLSAALCPDPGPCQTLTFAATADRGTDADGRVLWSEAVAIQDGYGDGQLEGAPGSNNNSTGGTLLKATFTGQQLYDALTRGLIGTHPLYVSGITYTWDASQPAASGIVEVRKDGVPIDRAATYTVAISNVLGGQPAEASPPVPELTTGSNYVVVPNVSPVILFGQYLSTLPQPILPPTLNRITRMNGGSGGSGGGN